MRRSATPAEGWPDERQPPQADERRRATQEQTMSTARPLSQQISEVRLTLSDRSRDWPPEIARGKMRQGEARERNTRLRAALATLELIAEHEDAVRELLASRRAGAAT